MLQGKRRGISCWDPQGTGHGQRQDHPPGEPVHCISSGLFECGPCIGAGFLENFHFLAQKFVEQGVFWGVDAGGRALVKCGVVACEVLYRGGCSIGDKVKAREVCRLVHRRICLLWSV